MCIYFLSCILVICPFSIKEIGLGIEGELKILSPQVSFLFQLYGTFKM